MIRTRWALATLLATCLVGACSDDDPEPDIADPTAFRLELVSDGESFADGVGHAGLRTRGDSATPGWRPGMRRSDGDTTDVRALSASSCESCDELIGTDRRRLEAGGTFDTPGWTIDRLKSVEQSQREVKVDVAMTMSRPDRRSQQAGATPVTYPEDQPTRCSSDFGKEDRVWQISVVGCSRESAIVVVVLAGDHCRSCGGGELPRRLLARLHQVTHYQHGVAHIEVDRGPVHGRRVGRSTTDEIRRLRSRRHLRQQRRSTMATTRSRICDIPPGTIPLASRLGWWRLLSHGFALPPSQLEVQPPNGRTLVNFDTNFFTDTRPFDRTVHSARPARGPAHRAERVRLAVR